MQHWWIEAINTPKQETAVNRKYFEWRFITKKWGKQYCLFAESARNFKNFTTQYTETVAILPRQFSWNRKDLLRQEQKYSNQPFSETRSVPQQYKNFFAKVISSGGFLEGFNYFPVTAENSPGRVTNHNLLKFVYSLGFFLNLLLRSVFPKFDSVRFFLLK